MEFRENQKETIDQIVKAFNRGVKTIVLFAPTGSGKTIINLFSGREMGGSYYSTPLRVLVDQIRADLTGKLREERLGWVIMGRSAYPCPYQIELENEQYSKDKMRATSYEKVRLEEIHNQKLKELTADGAPCTAKHPKYNYNGHFYDRCPFLDECGYYKDRDKAMQSQNIVTTLDYLLVGILPGLGLDPETDSPVGWEHRPIMVIDEAHYLPSKLADFYSINISKKSLPEFPYDVLLKNIGEGDPDKALAEFRKLLPDYKEMQEGYLDILEDNFNSTETDEIVPYYGRDIPLSTAIMRQRKLVNRLSFMNYSLETDVEWIYNRDDKGMYWKPYSPKKFVERFWNIFDHVILSSATFFGIKDYLDDLGLGKYPYEIIQVNSTFPSESAPIIPVSGVGLNKNNFETTIDSVVSDVDDILDKHPDERGIIHCNSYAYKKEIESRSRHAERFISHDSSDRTDKLREFISQGEGSNMVLLSVNMGEGIDLRDDAARFQIIVKCPYPFLGDPWTKLHFDRSKAWYENQTIIQIMQMCGRIIRSKEDWGVTYFIDRNIMNLLERNKGDLPAYFWNRIESGRMVRQKKIEKEFDDLLGI
jgi:Rad3-related DNA helicase